MYNCTQFADNSPEGSKQTETGDTEDSVANINGVENNGMADMGAAADVSVSVSEIKSGDQNFKGTTSDIKIFHNDLPVNF